MNSTVTRSQEHPLVETRTRHSSYGQPTLEAQASGKSPGLLDLKH